MSAKLPAAIVLLLLMIASFAAAKEIHATIVYDDVATEINPANQEAGQLWITTADLTRATHFEVKPQGVCRDELCFPIPEGRRSAFLTQVGSVTWFNLSEFARLVRQPAAYDGEQAVWYFGPRPDEQNAYLSSLVSPDFTLPDMNGRQRSLSEFRGKKVLLVTWASW